MGLDMYAFTVDAQDVGSSEVDVKFHDDMGEPTIPKTELAYWRKFNNLHGWMLQLYIKKGGKDPEFNCNNVRLMPEDLDQLEEATRKKALDPVEGFFFGAQEPMSDEDQTEVLDFIAQAREAIDEGEAVFYDSWW